MLTEPQFYMRVLEELLRTNSPCYDGLAECDDLKEFMDHHFKIKHEDEDDGDSQDKAMQHIELTLQGFVQALGKRVGIDLKFVPDE